MRFLLVAVVVPPLVVLATSLTHPQLLTVESASHWKAVHVWLLVWFPLLALGPWLVARAVHRPASRVVAIVAYVYATFYSALDIIGGIAAGAIKEVEAGGIGIVSPLAGDFETVGGVAFVVACTLGAGVALRSTGWVRGAAPAAAVVVGSIGLWQFHVFRPEGPVAMALLAAGWGTFVVLIDRGRPSPAA
jgi:hypothetical protein